MLLRLSGNVKQGAEREPHFYLFISGVGGKMHSVHAGGEGVVRQPLETGQPQDVSVAALDLTPLVCKATEDPFAAAWKQSPDGERRGTDPRVFFSWWLLRTPVGIPDFPARKGRCLLVGHPPGQSFTRHWPFESLRIDGAPLLGGPESPLGGNAVVH